MMITMNKTSIENQCIFLATRGDKGVGVRILNLLEIIGRSLTGIPFEQLVVDMSYFNYLDHSK